MENVLVLAVAQIAVVLPEITVAIVTVIQIAINTVIKMANNPKKFKREGEN